MSEPKRYSDLDVWKAFPFGENDSEWVKWEDYARLQAEVERLQSIHSIDSIGIEQLKAQVERLTKAGDNLEQVLTEISYSYRAGNASHEWRAAKEGKQS